MPPIEIFPFFLVRYPGLDYKLLRQWNYFDIQTDAINESIRELSDLKDALCDALFLLINQQTDQKNRQQLIDLKRLVYNQKRITDGIVSSCNDLLSQEINIQLTKYKKYIDDILLEESILSAKYQNKLRDDRQTLQRLAGNDDFRKALLFSSPVLFQQLTGFEFANPALFKQKELRIEFSLIRYLTRMALKTSPFSYFTHTGLGDVDSLGSTVPGQIKSNVRLNNALFSYFENLLKKHPVFNEQLFVRLNNTAAIDGDKIRFLVNFNNVEAFQSLPAKGLQLIFLQREFSPDLSFGNLIKHLSTQFDSDISTLKNYLLQLVSAGFLELDIKINGLDLAWDQKLLSFFHDSKLDKRINGNLKRLITELTKARNELPLADSATRNTILSTTEELVNQELLSLEAALDNMDADNQLSTLNSGFHSGKFKSYQFSAKQLFYEDCSTNKVGILPNSHLQAFIAKADRLINCLGPLDNLESERIQMVKFFGSQYERNAQVSLITFYHDYYFHFKKKDKENGSPTGEFSEKTRLWINRLKTRLTKKMAAQTDTLYLTSEDLPEIRSSADQYSKGVFAQFFDIKYDEPGEIYGVISAIVPGMGKISGRFLSMFDDLVTRTQIAHNNRLFNDDVIMAELNDASSFNANIHPPLLNYEITLPGGNSLYSPEQQLPVKGLRVSYDHNDNNLMLTYQGKRVYAMDLSLESFYFRSNLYQLLAHFNRETRPSLKKLIEIIDSCSPDFLSQASKPVLLLPRVVYDHTVVIRRRAWLIQTSYIPTYGAQEEEFSYYLKLNNWRLANGIPERVFIYLRKPTVFIDDKTEKSGKQDDYKPQFFSFCQPLMLIMLRKLLQRCGSQLYFEEALPDHMSGNLKEGVAEIKEYLIQWYKY